METSPKRLSPRSLVREILNDSDDITLGHKNHVVNISSASSVNSSPGNASAGEIAQRNRERRERGRNIDRFVASVLDDTNGRNSRSGGDSPHLSFLGETPSRSVNIDDSINDVSFEPLRPFEAHQDLPTPSKKQRLERRMKKHWKPITAACLVLVLVVGISLGTSKLKNKEISEKPGSSFVETPILPIWPTESPTTHYPTYSPTNLPTTDTIITVSPISASPTLGPTSAHPTESPATTKPTSGPTNLPTGRPTMVPEYYQMLKAAKYVSGTTERSGEVLDPFDNFTSPQSLAFHWLYYEGNPPHNILEFFEQYAVAVVFFSLTEIRQSSWGSTLTQDDFTAIRQPCGWSGVRCAYNYTSNMTHVTEVKLPMRGLKGPIPKEIGFLPYLTKLDLAENEIAGTIPDAIYNLQNLRHLYLNNNKLTGTISQQIDNLNLAEHIYLGQNYLNGTLPSTIGINRPNNWRFFSVYDNKLTGTIPMMMKLRNAYQLDFSNNQFEGELPSDINQENYSKLRMLYVSHNHLNGRIPSSLMEMKKMKVFYFNDNMFAGSIPEVGDAELARNLITVRAQHNQLTDPVPNGLCDLDVNKKYGELIELSVDCSICNDCDLCKSRCYN